jgi:beta-lactamase class A
MGSRRYFMGATAALSVASITSLAHAAGSTIDAGEIVSLFQSLPGDKAIRIWAPATDGKAPLDIAVNASSRMFVGSAIKTFILAEALRQADAPGVVKTLQTTQLRLDASVWSADSATFNPPNLIGSVSQRTALEAMIMHSDNTGTDMCLRHAGPDNVRRFIATAGLTKTAIPDSTRSFVGYLLGASDYRTFTWQQLQSEISGPMVNPPLNDVQTLASSADDFVSFYSRALQGTFFNNPATLGEYRRILSLGDAIWLVPLPLGLSAFCKGGSIDVPGFHCLCVAGGMFFSHRWVYFAIILNWDAKAETDPKTVAAFASAASQALGRVVEALAV